jgi:ComF family protein
MGATSETVIGRSARAVLDVLFPPLCISCREPVGDPGSLCATCWNAISFLEGAMCDRCGLPFELDPGPGTLCGACHARPPAFDKARAAMRYDEASKASILALKHADRLDLAPGLARWVARSGRALLDNADVLVPVPLHPRRLWWRRYNQSAELARVLAAMAGKRVDPLLLVRKRETPSQGAMPSAKARRRNMLGAFAVPPERKAAVKGSRVLLIDDVMTTGATVEACARALKRAGASHVAVLTLARVVRPLTTAL